MKSGLEIPIWYENYFEKFFAPQLEVFIGLSFCLNNFSFYGRIEGEYGKYPYSPTWHINVCVCVRVALNDSVLCVTDYWVKGCVRACAHMWVYERGPPARVIHSVLGWIFDWECAMCDRACMQACAHMLKCLKEVHACVIVCAWA